MTSTGMNNEALFYLALSFVLSVTAFLMTVIQLNQRQRYRHTFPIYDFSDIPRASETMADEVASAYRYLRGNIAGLIPAAAQPLSASSTSIPLQPRPYPSVRGTFAKIPRLSRRAIRYLQRLLSTRSIPSGAGSVLALLLGETCGLGGSANVLSSDICLGYGHQYCYLPPYCEGSASFA